MHQLLHPSPVLVGGVRAPAGRDPIHAVSAGIVRRRAGGGSGAVCGAPGLPRGAGHVALPCRAPQHAHAGLAGGFAPAYRGTADHARRGAGRVVRAGIFEVGAGRLHHHRRLPGGADPFQREAAVGLAALHHRDAGLPPLAPFVGYRGHRPQLRRALLVH
ncbi:hypothetical protein D3C78_1445460 [compost metagenome]